MLSFLEYADIMEAGGFFGEFSLEIYSCYYNEDLWWMVVVVENDVSVSNNSLFVIITANLPIQTSTVTSVSNAYGNERQRWQTSKVSNVNGDKRQNWRTSKLTDVKTGELLP